MYCPKCGLQNPAETKFCRGCGSDLSSLPTALAGRSRDEIALAEKQIGLFSSGVRGLITGLGFLIVAGVALGVSTRLAVLCVFAAVFGFYFLGTGISRLVHSRGLKRLLEPEPDRSKPELTAGQDEYIKPPRSIYETDNLAKTPISVTEHTTTHLKMDPDTDR